MAAPAGKVHDEASIVAEALDDLADVTVIEPPATRSSITWQPCAPSPARGGPSGSSGRTPGS